MMIFAFVMLLFEAKYVFIIPSFDRQKIIATCFTKVAPESRIMRSIHQVPEERAVDITQFPLHSLPQLFLQSFRNVRCIGWYTNMKLIVGELRESYRPEEPPSE